MNNVKYTGTNIAAAILILGFFFPWVASAGMSMSGFNVMSNGFSPGMLSYFISGFSRFFMILALLVPISGALILYQNITQNKKFNAYYKPAHLLPAVYLIGGIVYLYFKLKPDTSNDHLYGGMASSIRDMSPGITDFLSFGIYLSLAAAIYLLLVSMGKVKDKEYYTPGVTKASGTSTDSTERQL